MADDLLDFEEDNLELEDFELLELDDLEEDGLVTAAVLSSPALNQFQKLALALLADKTTTINAETTSPAKIIFLFFIFLLFYYLII